MATLCQAQVSNTAWGQATNGFRLGLQISTVDAFGKERDPWCILLVQNTATNFSYLRMPRRYKAELRGPDSHPVEMRRGGRLGSLLKDKKAGLAPQLQLQVDGFSLAEPFPPLREGKYELTISAWASTNRHETKNFFLLPPVTKAFTLTRGRSEN